MKTLLALALLTASASAQVTLSPLFTDHAVLQRNKPIPIWGTAAPNEAIDITLATAHAKATADANGAWSATLPKLPAGGPYTLKANNATATDILIGEVWLASGQSNMEFHLNQVDDPKAAAAAADHPQLRMFTADHHSMADPVDSLPGSWKVSTPATAGGFSAVGYYFAVSLLEHLKVPIGVIHSSWGGTPAEAWTPLPKLLADPVFAASAKRQSDAYRSLPADIVAYKAAVPAWEAMYHAADPTTGDSTTVPALTASWQPITMPAPNASLPFHGAAVLWLRRTVTLPDTLQPVKAHIDLGQLLERDTVFVNGQSIGQSGYGAEPEIGVPGRSYDIPPGLLHAGENTILVRVFAHTPGHTALGNGNLQLLLPGNGPLPLTGAWEYHLSFDQALTPEAIAAFPRNPQMSPGHSSSDLYNGMIYPMRDFPIAGALWYQGESNAGAADKYAGLMSDLITGWRKQWGYGFPFYIVQLPLYQDRNFVPLRAAQERITHDVPDTAIAVTIDTGDVTNIHPRNKQPVGDRLALIALHRVYGQKLEDSGPFFASAKPDGAKLRITFTHAEGLHATGATIPNFEIAGADGKFVPADAVVEKGSIMLSSAQVASPTFARYAWSPAPIGADVYNSANLPLAPFVTP